MFQFAETQLFPKDTEHAMQNAELEENIRHRQQAIDTLEEDVKRLQSGVDQMAHELEAKGKEILNIRSEANRTLRCVSIFWVFLCLKNMKISLLEMPEFKRQHLISTLFNVFFLYIHWPHCLF